MQLISTQLRLTQFSCEYFPCYLFLQQLILFIIIRAKETYVMSIVRKVEAVVFTYELL